MQFRPRTLAQENSNNQMIPTKLSRPRVGLYECHTEARPIVGILLTMKTASTSSKPIQLRCLTTALIIQFLALGIGHAEERPGFKWQSDRDIMIREVLSVEIEEDRITILAKAHEPRAPALRYHGKQINLVIKRPALDYNAGALKKLQASRQGPAAKEVDLKRFKIHRAQLWKSTVAAAQALKKGKEIQYIAYFNSEAKKTGDYITSMEGYGFIFSKGK